jgi:hypothetical protein
MGILFAYGVTGGPSAFLPAVSDGLTSVWFFWSMAAVMAALLLWAPLGAVERSALLALGAAALLGPWVTAYPTVGGLAMSVLMGASFLALVRALLRGRVPAEDGRLLIALSVAFLAMTAAGFSVAATGGSVDAALAFGGVMGTVMGVEVAYLIRRYYRGRMARPWIARRADESDLDVIERTPGPTGAFPSRAAEPPTVDPGVGVPSRE